MDQIDVATMTTAFLLLFFLVRARQLWSLGHEQGSEKKPRRLRARTPEDCPLLWRGTREPLSSSGVTTAANTVQRAKESARKAKGKAN